MKKEKIIWLVLFFLYQTSFSQVLVSGTIKSNNEILSGANIIAKPLTKGAKFSYAITNQQGKFSLKLTPNASYKFTISFMGYITHKEDVLLPNANFTKNFILQEDPNELQEVVIKYREPIKVKKDTTTYRTDAFTSGKERKLRQVLKKLPNVEVDRKGNVTVKGKKVTTVLVENKKFFTGDSKMAVNNIPANVIDEIQVIEDYNESPLLKGLENSDEVALNINLKEDKKKFVFGNLEVGAGVKDHYIVHPTLFRYSPKINVNFIGDYNNTADKSFTLRDYIKYSGGFNTETFSSLYSSPLAKLLREKDFNENKHLFGALSTQIRLNSKNDLDFFAIGLKDKASIKTDRYKDYTLNNLISLQEDFGNQNQEMYLGSLQLKSAPNEDVRIQFDTKLELSKAMLFNKVNRELNTKKTNFSTNDDIRQLSIASNFKMEKRFSSFHTSQIKVDFLAQKNDENENWLSRDAIFSPQLPLEKISEYSIFQNGMTKKYNTEIKLKHFWILNPTNHLYLTIKNKLELHKFDGFAYQNLSLANNNFKEFTNDVRNNRIQSFIKGGYKKLIGNAFLTLKLSYLNYNRFNTQFDKNYNKTLNLLLPEINLKWDIDRKRELNFTYKLANKFPEIHQLSLGKRIRSFNSIYRGNINLEEDYYHYLRLAFRKHQSYGWSFYPNISYRYKKNVLQNTYISDGIYNISSIVNNVKPNEEVSTNFRVSYNYKYWRAQLFTNYKNYKFYSYLNNDNILTINKSGYIRGSFRSVYIKGPNVDISLSQSYNYSKNEFYTNVSDITRLDVNFNHEVGNWQFNTDFLYNFYKNRNTQTTNSFNDLGASIFYQKEESPWAFELKAKNILDNKYKLSSGLTDILFSEVREYIMPRMIVFKVTYQL